MSAQQFPDLDARSLLASLPAVIWVAEADGSIVFVNEWGCDQLGKTVEELHGFLFMNLLHPADAQRVLESWTASRRTGAPYKTEYRIRMRTGEYRWHTAAGRPVRDAAGRIMHWMGQSVDCHEQLHRVERLRQANSEMRGTLALLDEFQTARDVGFAFVDATLRYLRVNETLGEFTGVPVGDFLGRRIPEVVPELWPQIEPLLRQAVEHCEPVVDVPVSGELAKLPGRERHFLESYYPVRAQDRLVGVAIVVREALAVKSFEEKLSAMRSR